MEAMTSQAKQTPVLLYAPKRTLEIILRDHSANGAQTTLRETGEQAAGAEKRAPSLSFNNSLGWRQVSMAQGRD